MACGGHSMTDCLARYASGYHFYVDGYGSRSCPYARETWPANSFGGKFVAVDISQPRALAPPCNIHSPQFFAGPSPSTERVRGRNPSGRSCSRRTGLCTLNDNCH